MCFSKKVFGTIVLLISMSGSVYSQQQELDLRFAGALEFSDNGTLFVGDNYSGAIYAFEMGAGKAPTKVELIKIDDIDVRIANLLGVGSKAIVINDMATHPVTSDIYISVARIGNQVSRPAIIRVAQDSSVELVDLGSQSYTKQSLANYPDQETTFRPRGLFGMPPTAKDLANGDKKLSSLAIMDIVFHNNEVFVSGVAYDNFLSGLRRMPFPFDGEQATSSVEMYHIAHDQYETRAPIRAMSIQNIDGEHQLVAAYTCSPLVLIPLDQIVDGAKISARTIADLGNGQPLDMIPYTFKGQKMLFLTNNSRSPQVVPLSGLNGAKVVNHEDFERGPKQDLDPVLPYGPVGEMVMFEGASLHIDRLGENFFVSLTRDAYTGSLNLDSNPSMFPNRVHNLQAEYDFPQYWAAKEKQRLEKGK